VSAALRAGPKGLFLTIKVTPKASRAEITGVRGGALLVRVTTAPENGKANAACTALMADQAGVPKMAFELASGATSRTKTFRIASHAEAVQAWISSVESGG
jgi:uncharacterized protein